MSSKKEVFKYTITAGILSRGSIKSKIQVYCFKQDIELSVIENKGLLDSTLLYEFKTTSEKVVKLKLFLDGIFNPYKPRFEQSKASKIIKKYADVLDKPLDDNFVIMVNKYRSDGELKDSYEDLKDAIKQTLLISTDTTYRQALVDGYILLGTFLSEDYYERLKELLNRITKLSKEEDDELSELIKNAGDYIAETYKVLGEEIEQFQYSNGFT